MKNPKPAAELETDADVDALIDSASVADETGRIEDLARAVYETMPFDEPAGEKPQWTPGGNSLRQTDARAYARRLLDGEDPTVIALDISVPAATEIAEQLRAALTPPRNPLLDLPNLEIAALVDELEARASAPAAPADTQPAAPEPANEAHAAAPAAAQKATVAAHGQPLTVQLYTSKQPGLVIAIANNGIAISARKSSTGFYMTASVMPAAPSLEKLRPFTPKTGDDLAFESAALTLAHRSAT